MNRKAIRKRRTQLIYEIDDLIPQLCEKCARESEGGSANELIFTKVICDCPASIRISEIGKELNQLSLGKRNPPERLNVEAFHLLKDWGWENRQIRKHYGISQIDFTFWMRSNGLLRNQKEEPEMVAEQKELSFGAMQDLRAQGESWDKIGKRMGVTGITAKNRFERMQKTLGIKQKPKPEQTVNVPKAKILEGRDAEIEFLKTHIEELEAEREAEKQAFYKLREENEELDRFNAELMERDKQNKNRIHNLEGAIEDERDRKDRELLSVRNQETEVSEYWRGEAEAEKKSRRLLESLIECKIREWEATGNDPSER